MFFQKVKKEYTFSRKIFFKMIRCIPIKNNPTDIRVRVYLKEDVTFEIRTQHRLFEDAFFSSDGEMIVPTRKFVYENILEYSYPIERFLTISINLWDVVESKSGKAIHFYLIRDFLTGEEYIVRVDQYYTIIDTFLNALGGRSSTSRRVLGKKYEELEDWKKENFIDEISSIDCVLLILQREEKLSRTYEIIYSVIREESFRLLRKIKFY